MARPILDPPCKNWDRDLPGPNDAPGKLEVMGEPPIKSMRCIWNCLALSRCGEE